MYRLFQELPQIDKGKVILPEFIYVRGHYLRQLAAIREYYHNTLRFVPNQHLLVRLLLSMNVSFNRDIRNYVDVAGDQALMLSSQLRVTSAMNHGFGFNPGVFYGSNVTEVIVIIDDPFDLKEAVDNWREMEPIRVLRHPFTDLSMGRPDGRYEQSNEKGLAVIEIHAGKLALQYRLWSQQEKGDVEGSRKSVHNFISMYPLTNMIASHLDIALFNRMVALYEGKPVAPYVKAHPFYIPDYTTKVDAVLKKQISIHENQRKDFTHLMVSTPLIWNDTLFEAMRLPHVIPTRQIKWALILARIPLIRFLVKFNDETNNQQNTFYLAKLRMSLREMKNDHVLYHGLSPEMIQDIEQGVYGEVQEYL
jgi:hypothetical protein